MSLGILNPFLYYVILFKAYSILPAQEAMTLNYTWPVMLILLSIPILKQKLSLKSGLAILLSFLGIIIISTKANLMAFRFSDFGGDMLALSSSVVWALYWLLNVKDHNDSVIKLFFNFLSGSILSLILMLSTEGFHLQTAAIPAFIYIGLFEMSLTFVFWLTALKYSSSTDKVSQLIFLSPFMSLFFIYIFIGESIHYSTLLGLFFIIAGILVQQLIKSKPQKNQN
jgi:drug/metabolite transporter (DMT)-like permease